MTQKIILHGEPAFLKQSPLGWYTLLDKPWTQLELYQAFPTIIAIILCRGPTCR